MTSNHFMSDIPIKMTNQHLIGQQEAFSDLFNGKPPSNDSGKEYQLPRHGI